MKLWLSVAGLTRRIPRDRHSENVFMGNWWAVTGHPPSPEVPEPVKETPLGGGQCPPFVSLLSDPYDGEQYDLAFAVANLEQGA